MAKTLGWTLVTGASSGIGAAIARRLDREGWNLILLARNTERLLAVQNDLSQKAHLISCDLSQADQRIKAAENVKALKDVRELGLRVLVNNAGIVERKPFFETNPEHWQMQLNVNTVAPAHLTQALWPLIKQAAPSCVVNVSSTLATRPLADTSAYGASKAALTQLTRVMALEGAPFGVRFNTVSPGIVETPIHQLPPEGFASLQGLQPLGRTGTPDEIAAAVAYLCSFDSQWTTGADLVIDGGVSLL